LQKLGGRSRELHLVALTGYGQDSDRRRSTKAGFGHHLVKPANLNELEQLVEQLSATD
jgi:CheY-like chemotaxis protein